MRILKITTYWTPEEADCIYQFLDECKEALWQSYGEEIVKMYQDIQDEQQTRDAQRDFDDELPF